MQMESSLHCNKNVDYITDETMRCHWLKYHHVITRDLCAQIQGGQVTSLITITDHR